MAEWWQDLFDEKYERLFAETRTPLRTAQETEGLHALFTRHGVPEAGAVLDLACGQGRISAPLAQLGYRVTGYDLSEYLLSRARQAAQDAKLELEWVHGDMRALPEAWNGRFDAVVNIFTAFGYFEEPQENQRVLEAVARVLKPGALLVIDVNHRDRLMAAYQATDWFEVDDLLVCTSREFDPISGMNTEVWLWTDERGDRNSLYFRVHIYTATELTRMLRAAGLEPIAYHGDLAAPPDDYPFDGFSRRLVVVARKGDKGTS